MCAEPLAAEPRRVGARLLPIDWGQLAPLRLRARVAAEGAYAGLHHSARRGSGVEYSGERPYVPGDDLRFLDRRSLLRHDRLMVREFETDTDRALWLCLDTSDSMAYRSAGAPGAKLAFAAVVAAALGRLALGGGDPVGLAWLGGTGLGGLPAAAGVASFERLVSALESVGATGPLRDERELVERCLRRLALRARRGSVVVLLSDLLDLPDGADRAVAALAAGARALVVVRALDPAERDLGFSGKIRLRALEGASVVETDADVVRAEYRARLAEHDTAWAHAVERDGGRFVRAATTDDPVRVVRAVVQACAEARRPR